jgi:hypothetical protein
MRAGSLERRVLAAASAALNRTGFVAPVDVLTGLGWLRPEHAEAWRRGRVLYLERVTVASLGKLSRALRIPRRWAQRRGLQPRETVYVSWTKDRHRLRFTKTGGQNLERAYRTHWISPDPAATLPPRDHAGMRLRKQALRLDARQQPATELTASPG